MNIAKIALFSIVISLVGCSKKVENSETNSSLIFTNDLEKTMMWNEGCNNVQTIIKNEGAHSGKFVTKLDSIAAYSLHFKAKLGDINNKPLKIANVSVWVKVKNLNADATLVVAIDSAGKIVKWQGTDLKGLVKSPNEWVEIKNSINIETKVNNPQYNFGCYLWNRSKEEILGDDFRLEFKE